MTDFTIVRPERRHISAIHELFISEKGPGDSLVFNEYRQVFGDVDVDEIMYVSAFTLNVSWSSSTGLILIFVFIYV